MSQNQPLIIPPPLAQQHPAHILGVASMILQGPRSQTHSSGFRGSGKCVLLAAGGLRPCRPLEAVHGGLLGMKVKVGFQGETLC